MNMRETFQIVNLALIGGAIYSLIEVLWRGYTHWSMGIVGGICFILLGLISKQLTPKFPLYIQAIIGTFLVTFIELISGTILNIWLKLSVWDYSDVPFNLLGQICLPYMLLWLPLSFLAIILYNWLSYQLFSARKPKLRLL